MYRGYELPPYTVAGAEGAIEIREYQPHLLAEVTVRGTRSDAIGRGFRVLANYIFGGNERKQKVAMTVPVSQLPASDGAADGDLWTVRFMMPATFDRASLPAPENPAIRFVEAAPERQAVIRFSGRWTEARLAEMEDRLTRYVAAQGLEVAGPPRYYFYDGPFRLPFQRRNEVALPLRG